MSTEKAIEFLRRHQPLPPTRQASDELLAELERVRRYFTGILDPRAVPLLIGALGEGDGHGIYPMVETTLLAYPDDVVVSALMDGLHSQHGSVRYWSAQFAANYPREAFLDLLADVYRSGGVDERIAAITAIEVIGTDEARRRLGEFLMLEAHPAVKRLIGAALGA
jgi:hypothetical protein